nr:helix-turn-helix transcriptional regulator [uncultured Flavobacterium sp.]
MNNKIVKNRIKEVAVQKGVSNLLIALKCNVHYTTVSQWFSNRQQPNLENTIKLLQLLEVNFTDIIIYENQSLDTGLGRILENEYKELVKKYPLKVELADSRKKTKEQIYNPIIVEALEKIEKQHKTKK